MTDPEHTHAGLGLDGKTALIAGGASGMGRAAAELFAAQGARVIVADKHAGNSEETVKTICEAGGSACHHVVDLGEQESLDDFLTTLSAEEEHIDVLHYHAGIPGPPRLDYDYDTWLACMKVNVWVPMWMTKRLLPLLRRPTSASVIVTSSIAGLMAVPGLPTYAASKAAVIEFVKSAALLFAPEGIRFNAVCPGSTDTPALRRDLEDGTVEGSLEESAARVPMGRLGLPRDIANAVLFLASESSSYITGVALPVDGGMIA